MQTLGKNPRQRGFSHAQRPFDDDVFRSVRTTLRLGGALG
jgi:hypothetical protein